MDVLSSECLYAMYIQGVWVVKIDSLFEQIDDK